MPVMSAGGFRSQKLPHRGIGPGVRGRLAIQVGGVDVDAEFHSKSYGFEGEKLQFGGIRTDEATHASRAAHPDCRHESEPGCAVLNAVAGDTLDEVRLGRYFKLQAEEGFNTQTVAQRRSHNKTFGKLIKDVKKEKKKRQR